MKLLSALGCVLLVASCATVRVVDHARGAHTIIELVNADEADTLTNNSHVPFLLDGEIIMIQSDVLVLWQAIVEHFTLESETVHEMPEELKDVATLFGQTMDVRVFFQNLPDEVHAVRIDTSQGELILLLGTADRGVPRIYGLKGFS